MEVGEALADVVVVGATGIQAILDAVHGKDRAPWSVPSAPAADAERSATTAYGVDVLRWGTPPWHKKT